MIHHLQIITSHFCHFLTICGLSGSATTHTTFATSPPEGEWHKVVEWKVVKLGEVCRHLLAKFGKQQITSKLLQAEETMLRRAPKTQVRTESWVRPDGLDYCLECWRAWMGGDGDRDLGMQTLRGLAGDGDGHGPDMHEAQQASDTRIAVATDAMIDSLATLHRWAIYASCSVATPWKFPNADLVHVAADARDQLANKLKNNICTSVLF